MFSIRKASYGPYTQVTIQNEDTGEFFRFLPDCGACFQQLALRGADLRLRTLLEESPDPAHFLTVGQKKFQGSKLFPFANRINSGAYTFQGASYQLPVNEIARGHALHGLLYQSSFQILEEKANSKEGSVTLQYAYDREEKGYPFKIDINIIFTLDEKQFSCRTIIQNKDQVPVPFSDGWHPYFVLDNHLNDSFLFIPSKERVELDGYMIPTGRTQANADFLKPKKIGEEHFDTCFRLQQGEMPTKIQLMDSQKETVLDIWLGSSYRYLQVYTPPSRKSIALEPMTSPPDAFNNHIDLLVLSPNELIELDWGIRLR